MTTRSLIRAACALLAALLLILAVLGWQIAQPFAHVGPSRAVVPVDSARLMAHVKALSTTFAGRHIERPQRLRGAGEYIEAELRAMGYAPVRQTYTVDGQQVFNIVLTLGAAPAAGQVRRVIGAHYDSFADLPAADDNASGVAGVLELARALKSAAEHPMPLDIVFWTLEEPPHFRTPQMGSAVHAASLKAAGATVDLMISVESIGYFSDAPNTQTYPVRALGLGYPTVGNFIGVVGRFDDSALTRRVKAAMQRSTSLAVYSINAPAMVPGIDFSDQQNYWNEGFTGVMVTNTALFRNRNYHTPQDTWDKLDYQRMAQVVEALVVAVRAE